MKTCASCLVTKDLSSFYPNRGMKDGYLSFCKECVYEKKKAYRATEQGRAIRKKEKQYPEAKRKYKKSEKGKEAALRYKRPRDREAAKNAVKYALKVGKLTRMPCEICGSKAEAHHWSYKREHRLDVKWLCRPHHAEEHIRLENKKSWA